MKIVLIEPYYSGSHKYWADGLKKYSRHQIELITLPGQFWKWRMHGGAISLANQYENLKYTPDLILSTGMLDLSLFLSLTRKETYDIPTITYFHENQLSYPWSDTDRDKINKRDDHYSFINYSTALVSDLVLFNSKYQLESFFVELSRLLNHFPDRKNKNTIPIIKSKSKIQHLGIDLKSFDRFEPENKNNTIPLILWNHRWEYDKNPEEFFKTLIELKNLGYKFHLAVLGENFSASPQIFNEAKDLLKKEIVHFGFVKSFSEYAQWIWKADFLPCTNIQEFFGVSVMEAIYCKTIPILPKRLSYPELIPNEFQGSILYSNANELLLKLKQGIDQFNSGQISNYQSIAEKYDWINIIHQYDSLFEELAGK